MAISGPKKPAGRPASTSTLPGSARSDREAKRKIKTLNATKRTKKIEKEKVAPKRKGRRRHLSYSAKPSAIDSTSAHVAVQPSTTQGRHRNPTARSKFESRLKATSRYWLYGAQMPRGQRWLNVPINICRRRGWLGHTRLQHHHLSSSSSRQDLYAGPPHAIMEMIQIRKSTTNATIA
jgi:hypothetical protein